LTTSNTRGSSRALKTGALESRETRRLGEFELTTSNARGSSRALKTGALKSRETRRLGELELALLNWCLRWSRLLWGKRNMGGSQGHVQQGKSRCSRDELHLVCMYGL
jgi:hypothetical protein